MCTTLLPSPLAKYVPKPSRARVHDVMRMRMHINICNDHRRVLFRLRLLTSSTFQSIPSKSRSTDTPITSPQQQSSASAAASFAHGHRSMMTIYNQPTQIIAPAKPHIELEERISLFWTIFVLDHCIMLLCFVVQTRVFVMRLYQPVGLGTQMNGTWQVF